MTTKTIANSTFRPISNNSSTPRNRAAAASANLSRLIHATPAPVKTKASLADRFSKSFAAAAATSPDFSSLPPLALDSSLDSSGLFSPPPASSSSSSSSRSLLNVDLFGASSAAADYSLQPTTLFDETSSDSSDGSSPLFGPMQSPPSSAASAAKAHTIVCQIVETPVKAKPLALPPIVQKKETPVSAAKKRGVDEKKLEFTTPVKKDVHTAAAAPLTPEGSPPKKQKTALPSVETPQHVLTAKFLNQFRDSREVLTTLYFAQTGQLLRGGELKLELNFRNDTYKVQALGGTPFKPGKFLGSGSNKYVCREGESVIKFWKMEMFRTMPPAYFRGGYMTKMMMHQHNLLKGALAGRSDIGMSHCTENAGFTKWDFKAGTALDTLLPEIAKGIKKREDIETSPHKKMLYALRSFFELAVQLDTPLDLKPDNLVFTKEGMLMLVDIMERLDYFRESDVVKVLKTTITGNGESPMFYVKTVMGMCSYRNPVLYKFFVESIEAMSKQDGPHKHLAAEAFDIFATHDLYVGNVWLEIVPDFSALAQSTTE